MQNIDTESIGFLYFYQQTPEENFYGAKRFFLID